MGKDEKEETGFGFKDRAKAEETIVLLADKEVAYQRLTVRGLLGRAKRVLSLTKAEEKIKNIKEAMAVFEEWLEKYSKEHPPKNSAKSKPPADGDEDMEKDNGKEKSPSSDTVPGLGFKDKAKAEETIKLLEGRDPDYQRLAVKGLIQRAKRVLTCTKDEEKLQNMKEALEVFDSFLDEFDRLHLSRQNNSYLPLAVVVGCADLSEEISPAAEAAPSDWQRFLQAYRDVSGDYKRLRTVPAREAEDVTWDIVRNRVLKQLKEKHKDAKLFDSEGKPTKEHLEMILWAYSPEEHKTKKLTFPNKEERDINKEDKKRDEREKDKTEAKKEDRHRDEKREDKKREEKREDRKRDEKREESKKQEKEKSRKRKSSSGDRSSSSGSSEESPNKKRKD